MIIGKSSQKGAAVVEFAILALLLLVFVMGIIEFGFLWMQSHYIANAAREGARVAAKIGGTDAASVTARETAAETSAREHLRQFFPYGDKVDDPGFLDIDVVEKDLPGSPVTPAPRVVEVTVTVQSAQIYRPILWALLNQIPGLGVFPDDFLTSLTQSANFVILY